MKILITGARGFIGRNIKEYLEKSNNKYDLYTPDSTELDCLDENAVKDYLEQHRFDVVLHMASYGDSIDKSKDGTHILDYNLRIFLNFSKNAHLYGKMYYAGSGAEYDKRYPISNVTEEQVGYHIPTDAYGLMKYSINQIIEKSENMYNFRLFGIFGKYEHYPIKFISLACCKAIKDLPLAMRQNVVFDYLWIDDFCRMVEFFLEHDPKYHTYNMVSGMKVSLQEICETVVRISKKQLPVYICREGLGNEYTASNVRFLQECSDFRFTPLEQAIEDLYDWYLKNQDMIDIYQLFY